MQWLIAAVTKFLTNFTPLTDVCPVFNVGQYRRELVGVNMSYDYYDPFNTTGAQSRRYVLIGTSFIPVIFVFLYLFCDRRMKYRMQIAYNSAIADKALIISMKS